MACGWVLQNLAEVNLQAGQGVAVREVTLEEGHGRADYLLFVDGQAAGAIEAKPAGHTLTGVVFQPDQPCVRVSHGVPQCVSP